LGLLVGLPQIIRYAKSALAEKLNFWRMEWEWLQRKKPFNDRLTKVLSI
jgi:hypothetical protein